MHLRRALLLFAIVLGLAALATAASQPTQRERRSSSPPAAPPTPTARPAPRGVEPARVRVGPRARSRPRRIEAGRPTEVLVSVPAPGQVELRGLGLDAAADPVTPARFDVLVEGTESVQVLFTRVGETAPRRLGVLVVKRSAR